MNKMSFEFERTWAPLIQEQSIRDRKFLSWLIATLNTDLILNYIEPSELNRQFSVRHIFL